MRDMRIIGILAVSAWILSAEPAELLAQPYAKIYYTDRSSSTKKVRRCNLDGSNPEDLVTSGQHDPRAIAVDTGGGKMYWCQSYPASIHRANLDGTGVQDIVTSGTSDNLQYIALDPAGGKMYWTEYDPYIRRANLDGSGLETLISGGSNGADNPRGIDLDVSGGKMYWVELNDRLNRANLNGSGRQIIRAVTPSVYGLALDVAHGKMYYSRSGPNNIERCNLDGTGTEVLSTGSTAEVIDLDLFAGKIYWIAGSSTFRANLDGSAPESIPVPNAGLGMAVIPEADCNTNAVPDSQDVVSGFSEDCNANGVPDECEGSFSLYAWAGADGGRFTTPANWSPPTVPGGRALLANSGPADNRAVLDQGGEQIACELTIQATGSGRQILQIESGSELTLTGPANILPGGEVFLRGGQLTAPSLSNSANTVRGYGTLASNVDNAGAVAGSPGQTLTVEGSVFNNAATGSVQSPIGSAVVIEAASFSQAGDLEARSNGTLAILAPLTNQSGGAITLLGGTLGAHGVTNNAGGLLQGTGAIDTSLTNDGDVVAFADLLIVGNLVNNGTITLQSGTLTVTGGVSGSGVIIGGFGG